MFKLSFKAFIPFFILLLISCYNSEKKEINNVLNKRQNAFEQKDETIYSDLILDSYRIESEGEISDKESVINQFKINISPFDKVSFVKSKREIFIKNFSAKVIIDCSIDLAIEDQTVNYNKKELLSLIKVENKGWKISKESDLDLFRGFVFGEK